MSCFKQLEAVYHFLFAFFSVWNSYLIASFSLFKNQNFHHLSLYTRLDLSDLGYKNLRLCPASKTLPLLRLYNLWQILPFLFQYFRQMYLNLHEQ